MATSIKINRSCKKIWSLDFLYKGRTVRKVMVGGEFSAYTSFCAAIFFQVKPSSGIFFIETNIDFFFKVKSWSLSMFLCFINYSTITTDQSRDIDTFNAKSFRKCTHSERGGSHLDWPACLSIFSVLLSGIPRSPIAHHNDAILHSPKQPLCGALYSKMSFFD